MITQTEGGKFRIYHDRSPVTIRDDLEAALKCLFVGMVTMGASKASPEDFLKGIITLSEGKVIPTPKKDDKKK